MSIFPITKFLKPAIIGGAVLGLSACMVPGGYYGDGYVNGASSYGCDPYAPFDDYYACDDGYGYANIGYGGGWYDNFYYPGYGTYIFDRRGTRYGMKQHHRRHWARQRADYGVRDGRWRNGRYKNGNGNAYRDGRGRDLTPRERAERRDERQDRRAERDRDLTPEQRAVRQERRAERRTDNRNNAGANTRRSNRGENVRRGNRQPAVVAPARRGRPAMAEQQPQRRPAAQTRASRPQPAATPRQAPTRQAAPVARPAPRVNRSSREVNRRDVSDE